MTPAQRAIVEELREHFWAAGAEHSEGDTPECSAACFDKADALAALLTALETAERERDELKAALPDPWHCVCGCPADEHENLGEDGIACERDHICYPTHKAIADICVTLRAQTLKAFADVEGERQAARTRGQRDVLREIAALPRDVWAKDETEYLPHRRYWRCRWCETMWARDAKEAHTPACVRGRALAAAQEADTP